jgi:hypothetical protein
MKVNLLENEIHLGMIHAACTNPETSATITTYMHSDQGGKAFVQAFYGPSGNCRRCRCAPDQRVQDRAEV